MTKFQFIDAMEEEFSVLYMTIIGALEMISEFGGESEAIGLYYQYNRTKALFDTIDNLEEDKDKQPER